MLTDDPATGDVRVLTVESGQMADAITRADLAAFVVARLSSDEHLRRAVTVTST